MTGAPRSGEQPLRLDTGSAKGTLCIHMRKALMSLLVLLVAVAVRAGDASEQVSHVPEWGKSAVWYQIFPERFRNGDSSNDPTTDTLEMHFPNVEGWRITPWNGDYFARDGWEEKIGKDFYENGTFHRRYGGDLQGVIDKLDYLKDLGINAIYFNPVFYARSLHKYDGNTYHHIDPNFGPDPKGDFEIIRDGGETSDPSTWKWTAADKLFLELIKEAHKRGIRVVIDGVFNHSGRDFFAFRDIRINGVNSPYKDWYTIKSFDNPETRRNELRYAGWAGFFTLPEFRNTEDGSDLHPGPKKYIFDATRRWMDPNGDGNSSDGIDGWRLDVANELPDKFWRDWNNHVFSINPQAITVPEIWIDASRYLADTGFSATMNYYAFAEPVKGFLIDGGIKPSKFAEELNKRREKYSVPVQLALWNVIDSHDTPRLAQMVVNRNTSGQYKSPEKFDYNEPGTISARDNSQYQVRKPNEEDMAIQKLVALFQATYVGAPIIYYGDEAGVWGGQDPDCRKPMPWPDIQMAPEQLDPRGRPRTPDDANFDEELHAFFRDVIGVHASSSAFKTSDFSVLVADDEKGVFAYSRGTGSDLRVVVINRSGAEQTISIPAPITKEVFSTSRTSGRVKVSSGGGKCVVTLPALTGVVLQ